MPKKLKTDRQASYGSFTLAEEQDGSLSSHFSLEETDGVNPEVIVRIRCILSGFEYLFQHDANMIEQLGLAYLEGMERGIRQMKDEEDKHPKMGFNAKLKDEK